MRTLLVPIAFLVACTPVAVTPPGRTLALDSPAAPVRGTDLGIETGHVGQIFGPEANLGAVRVRHTLEPGVVGEVDGGLIHVSNDGTGPTRDAATGRLGLLLQTAEQRAALGVGIGGGTSAVGTWSSVDAGVMIAGKWRYLRPVLGGWLGYSAPLSRHPFTINESDERTGTTLQLPHNVFVQVNAGLEIGPPECALVVGLSVMNFWLREDSVVQDSTSRTTTTPAAEHVPRLSQGFAAVGIGLRLSL